MCRNVGMRWSSRFALVFVMFSQVFCAAQQNESQQTDSAQNAVGRNSSAQESAPVSSKELNRKELKKIVALAFAKTHDGWSADEVLLDDQLNGAFLAECQRVQESVTFEQANWTLLNLRKAGGLTVRATKRNNVKTDDVRHVAEIVARNLHVKYSVSTDRLMVSREKRNEFNALALSILPGVDTYRIRKAAFGLRKARKLKPELITRIANWGRKVETFSVAEVRAEVKCVPEKPGVYIFRDHSGYLYIGQTDNLRARLKTHLDQSHSKSLANYLIEKGHRKISIEIHSFDPKSQARQVMVRRAYESELIASRKPRFNIQP